MPLQTVYLSGRTISMTWIQYRTRPITGCINRKVNGCVSLHLICWAPLTLLADSVNGARHDDKSSRCRELLSLERSQHPNNDRRRCERHKGPTRRTKRL